MRYKPLALAAATLAAGLLTFGGAQAANVMTGAPVATMPAQDGNVHQVKYKYWYNNNYNHHHHHNGGSGVWLGLGLLPFLGGGYGGGYGYPYGGYGGGYGYPYGGYGGGYGSPYGGYGGGYGYPYRGYGGGYGYPYGYGSGYGYGYGSGYAYRRNYYAAGGSRHVRYCLGRYRTYSVRSDTFVGSDGYRHRCRSPYRY